MSRSIIVLLLLIILTSVGISIFFDDRQILDNYQNLKFFVASYYLLSLIVFFLVYLLAIALSLPLASILTFIGAALFDWTALPVIVVAASLGALCVFFFAKTLFRSTLEKRVHRYLSGLGDIFQESPIRWCLAMRLVPFIPFWAANIIPAVLGMGWWQFFLATCAGIIPGTAVYVGLGIGLDSVFSDGKSVDLNVLQDPAVWGPLVGLGILIAFSTRFKSTVL